LLRSALHFDDKTAGEVMTPIGAVVAIDISCDRQAVQDIIRANKFSRFPVYQRDPERIVGILDNRSWIKAHLAGGNVSVRKLMRKAMYAPAEMGIDELLDKMTQGRTHMCVVTGENSTALGIITVEDILEELVGEIMDEDDVSASEMGGAAG